jgi:Putative regulator of cell autolysis
MEKVNDNWIELLLTNPKLKIVKHLFLQVFILLLSMDAFGDQELVYVITKERILDWLLFYAIINVLCYLNIYLLTPRLLLKGKINRYKWFIVSYIILFAIISLSLQVSQDSFMSQKISVTTTIFGVISTALCMGLILLATSTMTLFVRWMEEQKRVNELKIMTKQSELNLLKQQINPHFLFNMLNNANVLLKRAPEEASQVLFKLEELLNYQLNDSSKESVRLYDDINFLNDFLNLEKIRRDHFDYSIVKEGNTEITVPPLLFIPFVENAIKHNSDNEKESYVHITFRITDDELYFQSKNSKPDIAPTKSEVGGLGLKNIRRRLELLYPNKHTLQITNEEQTFNIILTINH